MASSSTTTTPAASPTEAPATSTTTTWSGPSYGPSSHGPIEGSEDSNGLTPRDYRAVVITPIVCLCVGILGLLLWRRWRRQKREQKAGFRRELNPETGSYEMRPIASLGRARLRMGGEGGEGRIGGARPVVRRVDSGAGPPPPAYEEAVEGIDGGRLAVGLGDVGNGEGREQDPHGGTRRPGMRDESAI